MVETRKLAAILAADVVGYSRLMGADEAGTARLVRERREAASPIIAGLGGRLVKTMGDGLLLEFPSVVGAVECAIAMQKQMAERNEGVPDNKRVIYRIGVNLGDVLIDGEDILGDGVNIAARLEGVAEPGGICISSSAYDHVRGRIEAEFVDLGEKTLKNIARPVRVFAVRSAEGAVALAPDAPPPEKLGPPRLSIVVLPFANMGGDPEQDFFVDGVTESLTTDLSRIAGSFVIARNTAFAYKGKARDVKQIGRELGVRYVLEGSVQRGGARMRVNVQLIDATTGNHLWAERFDKPVADLLDMQDEIVSRLANQLRGELIAAEARRAEREANPDSMDLYFQGVASFNSGNREQARIYFERAVALDPGNVDALVGVARVDASVGSAYTSDDRDAQLAAAEAALLKALSMAPSNVWAHLWLGLVQIHTNRAALGISELERTLTLNPNLAWAHAWIGFAKTTTGRAEETVAHIDEAFRLSPREGGAFIWHNMVGGAKLYLGADGEAVAGFRRSIETNRNYPLAHFYISAALAHLGELQGARSEAQAGLTLDPKFSIRRYRAGAESDNPIYLAQRERVIEGMRLAGIPEA
jgi:TolB-like protein/class 3 adenylate cyclase/Flp pilus assembly protein TadD